MHVKLKKAKVSNTYGGNKYSGVSSKSSSYPKRRKTVQVVSCLPRWMKSVCRKRKPKNQIMKS